MSRTFCFSTDRGVDSNAIKDPYEVLAETRRRIDRGDEIIPIRAEFCLTKTRRNPSTVFLWRDFPLERDVDTLIASRSHFESIMRKYRGYDPDMKSFDWPRHFAAHVLGGAGSTCAGDNIFMFFPQCLGISSEDEDDFFGFELIDVWETRFHTAVFPCVKRVFDLDTQLEVFRVFRANLSKTLYLASLFHEVGHRVGPFKVSPKKNPRLKISDFHLDVLGELSTDTLEVVMLQKFPEVRYFVILYRLFLYGRYGFKDNALSASVNDDNDGWLGSYLWRKCLKHGCITRNGDRWHMDVAFAPTMFVEILKEIDDLGFRCLERDSQDEQDEIVETWMRAHVDWNEQDGFVLPEGLRDVFYGCQDIPEKAFYAPELNLHVQ